VSSALSLAELVDRGENDHHLHAPIDTRPSGTLEWLGLAVGELPYLTSAARTVDDLNWRSCAPFAARAHLGLIDAFGQQLASSAALLHNALTAHVPPAERDVVLNDVDFLSHALVEDRPPMSRRSELLAGGYVTALAAAVQASGRAAASEFVTDALTRALATLLGHARLNDRDRAFLAEKVAGRSDARGDPAATAPPPPARS
jgi:hypothetical protein